MKYFINNDLDYNCMNVIYLISCTNCNEQYLGSATEFKKHFRIHKSDINTNKDRCWVACQFINECRDLQNPPWYPLRKLYFLITLTGWTAWQNYSVRNIKAIERSDLHYMCFLSLCYIIRLCVNRYMCAIYL